MLTMNIRSKKGLILLDQKKLKSFFEEYYKPLTNNKLKERIYDEGNNRDRNSFMRDYSRILYSSSFRRLQGKMQLLGVRKERFYRNRLTHSIEVSQIARSIAEILSGKAEDHSIYQDDMYILEAASIAHDIGNPPFGHHGERILNQLASDIGGFEGNAQTLRVLHRLEKKLPNEKGLNLTKRTLLSVVKYFKKKDDFGKFVYNEDYKLIQRISKETNVNSRTIDVQIMDLADEIAYGSHDLEDSLSLGLFSIDEFMFEFKEVAEPYSYNFLKERVEAAQEFAKSASNYYSSEEFAFLFRKDLISNIVHELILDIGVKKVNRRFKNKHGTKNTYELDFIKLADFAKQLKKITFKCINRTDIVQIYEKQGEKVLKGLYEAFMDDNFNKKNKLLPIEYRTVDEKRKERAVIDYLAGMMDSYAIKVYKDIYGKSAFDKIYDPLYFGEYE